MYTIFVTRMFVKINHKLLWLHTICLALICFFSVKGYHATAWGTKDLNFGGTNLTHVNYANIAGEIKFIDTLKYYQKRLSELDATLSEDKKNSVKQLTKQFFNKHSYFAEVWKYLGNSQKNKISEGKGIIPYGRIVDMNSMFLTPENDVFFEKSEFCSDLKQNAMSDSDYEEIQPEKFHKD